MVSQGADPDEIGLMNIDEQLPVLEYPQPGLDVIKVLSGQAAPGPGTPLGRCCACSLSDSCSCGLRGPCGWRESTVPGTPRQPGERLTGLSL